MAYSHSRLRNTLALVRVLTGVLFLFGGGHQDLVVGFRQESSFRSLSGTRSAAPPSGSTASS